MGSKQEEVSIAYILGQISQLAKELERQRRSLRSSYQDLENYANNNQYPEGTGAGLGFIKSFMERHEESVEKVREIENEMEREVWD